MLPKSLTDAERVFTGKLFEVRTLDVPGRESGTYRKEVVVHPGAVIILPLLRSGAEPQVAMIRNERVATGQTLWELPAGTLGPLPETPDGCAARELIEETGYQAQKITKLVEFYTSPGICTELMHAYLATDLKQVGQQLEASERITVEVMTLDRTMQLVKDNTIRDGKTIATLLYYHAFCRDEN